MFSGMGSGSVGRVLWWVGVLAVVLAACSAVEDSATSTSVPDLVIEGTRDAYTFDETQSFGEFGPVLWGLVTTINGTDQIEHSGDYGWVVWGDLWAGYLPVSTDLEFYGVTDLSAVDAEAVAAVIPVGDTIVLRQVRWSLDQLNDWKAAISVAMPDNGICSVGYGYSVNRINIGATSPHPDLGDVPAEAVVIEVVPDCSGYATFPASL